MSNYEPEARCPWHIWRRKSAACICAAPATQSYRLTNAAPDGPRPHARMWSAAAPSLGPSAAARATPRAPLHRAPASAGRPTSCGPGHVRLAVAPRGHAPRAGPARYGRHVRHLQRMRLGGGPLQERAADRVRRLCDAVDRAVRRLAAQGLGELRLVHAAHPAHQGRPPGLREGLDEEVGKEARHNPVGDGVGERHHGDGQVRREGLGEVVPVHGGCRGHHEGADDDQRRGRGRRRNCGEDRDEEYGEDKIGGDHEGREARAAALCDARAGLVVDDHGARA
mmetsp:Transcript_11244/g.38326  ORF Transcript_11244/g.38326 Transcript_11244/m.38326 type:complete len:281 (-) Transcript_11244:960-1802(-)